MSVSTGALLNSFPVVGASVFVNFTIINFQSNVTAVAFDVWTGAAVESSVIIRVFGTDGTVLDSLTAIIPVPIIRMVYTKC